MEEPTLHIGALQQRHSPWRAPLLGGGAILTAVIIGCLDATVGHVLERLVVASAVWLGIWAVVPVRTERRLSIAVDRRGLYGDGTPLCLREDVRAGLVVPSSGRKAMVRLLRTELRSPIELEVCDETMARGLLRALGVDERSSVASFDIPSPVFASFAGRVIVFITAAALLGPAIVLALGEIHVVVAAVLALTFFVAACLAWMLTKMTITVGVDGLAVVRPLRRDFIPWGSVDTVGVWDDSDGIPWQWLELHLLNGRLLRFPLNARAEQDGRGVAILDRIRRAMTTHRTAATEREAISLRSGTESEREWFERLRATTNPRGYRFAPVAADELWCVVENPLADAEVRVGAAVALLPLLDEAGRARMRVAAEATALPQVRVVLSAVAREAGEEELTAALGEVRGGTSRVAS